MSAGRGDLLVENVTVIDGDGSPPRPDQVVVVVDGRIDHVGPAASYDRPWEGQRISGRGRWLVPGLIDLHNHSTEIADMACYLANGVTTVRFSGIDTASLVQLNERLSAEAIAAPSLLTCGPMLDTAPPSWPQWARTLSSEDQARQVVRELCEGEDVDALFGVHGLGEDLLRAIVETAREYERPVVGQLWRVDARECAEIGIRQLDNTSRVFATSAYSIEELVKHRPVSERLTFLARAWVAIDWDRTEPLMASMVESDVAYCPTLVVWEYLAGIGRAELETDPDFTRYFGDDEHERFAALTNEMNKSWSQDDRYFWGAALETRYEWIRRFHAMGGIVVLGTDTQFGGIQAHRELATLVDCGLTPSEAIAAGTGTAARVAGKHDIGTLEQGSVGDLVLLSADPLVDISNLREIELVIQGGEARRPDELFVANAY